MRHEGLFGPTCKEFRSSQLAEVAHHILDKEGTAYMGQGDKDYVCTGVRWQRLRALLESIILQPVLQGKKSWAVGSASQQGVSINKADLHLASPRPSAYHVPNIPPKGGSHADRYKIILAQKIMNEQCLSPHPAVRWSLASWGPRHHRIEKNLSPSYRISVLDSQYLWS